MNQIIVYTDPVAPFQKVMAIKGGQVIDQIGVLPNSLIEIVFATAQKYDIQDICFTGVKTFALGFIQDMKTTYSVLNINFMEM